MDQVAALRHTFLGRAPRYTHLPWWLVHTGAFFWAYVVQGKGEPAHSRREGMQLTVDYLVASIRHRIWRRLRRARLRALNFASYVRHPGRALGRLVERLCKRPRPRRVVVESIVPALREAASVLRAPEDA